MSEDSKTAGLVTVELTMEELYQAIGGCLMMESHLTHHIGTFAHAQKAKAYKALGKKLDTLYAHQFCRQYEKTEMYLATYDAGKGTWKAGATEKAPPKPNVPLGKKAARTEVGAKSRKGGGDAL